MSRWCRVPADALRRDVSGDTVTYVVNRNINYTNVCKYKCTFCAFSKGKMAEHLKTTIGEVRGTSASMLEHSLALVASAEQVSQSSQVQSNAATGMAASVDEMSVSIDQVVQHAHDAQRISGASGQVASQGAEVITGIQDGARAAVAQMEEGVGRVEQGGVLANRAGQAIGEIDVSTRALTRRSVVFASADQPRPQVCGDASVNCLVR